MMTIGSSGGLSKLISGDPLPLAPSIKDLNQDKFNRDLLLYLRRLSTKFTGNNILQTMSVENPGQVIPDESGLTEDKFLMWDVDLQALVWADVSCELLDIWVHVTQNSSKTYLSNVDFRGRHLWDFFVFSDNGTGLLSDRWYVQSGTDQDFLTGPLYDSTDIEIFSTTMGAMTVTISMEGSTGKLYAVITNYSSNYDFRLFVLYSDSKSAADITI